MCVYWCIVIFLQVDYCLLKPQKRLNWLNVAITTTGRLRLRWHPNCFLKSCENANICLLKSFPWIFQKTKTIDKNTWNERGVASYTYSDLVHQWWIQKTTLTYTVSACYTGTKSTLVTLSNENDLGETALVNFSKMPKPRIVSARVNYFERFKFCILYFHYGHFFSSNLSCTCSFLLASQKKVVTCMNNLQ